MAQFFISSIGKNQQLCIYRPIIAEKATVYEERARGWSQFCYKGRTSGPEKSRGNFVSVIYTERSAAHASGIGGARSVPEGNERPL
jgi:hypothetical protein